MEQNKIITRSVYVNGLQIREAEEGKQSRKIVGYAVVFNSPYTMYEDDYECVREFISPSAITREVLNNSDFVMTMFHNNQLVLARAKNGEGTLSYNIDERGASFEFDAPNTVDGDKALELIRRGDIDGCSFAFTCNWDDKDAISERTYTDGNKSITDIYVQKVQRVYDFTLTPNPAYKDTECSCRDLAKALKEFRENVDSPSVESAGKADAEQKQEEPKADAPRIQQYQKLI